MSALANPTDTLPSTDAEQCDLNGCKAKWAWSTDRRNGPRYLRLCEDHATRWLQGERDLYAEMEEVAGRAPPVLPMSSLFGLVRCLDGRSSRRSR